MKSSKFSECQIIKALKENEQIKQTKSVQKKNHSRDLS